MGIIDSFFKRIKAMRRQRSKASAIPARLPDVDEAPSDQQPMLVAFAQSTGLERKHNEDALLVMVHNSAGEESMADFALFVVADGMGGHRSGEIASAIAARTFARRLAQDTYSDLLDYEAHGHNRAPILEVFPLYLGRFDGFTQEFLDPALFAPFLDHPVTSPYIHG